jgi:DNA-directed RNA polymerase specialized sigma24 family protein
MHEQEWLAEHFEENRGHLRAVAYRMLGSLSEPDDAVQETWLKLTRSGASGIDNPPCLADHCRSARVPGHSAGAELTS